MGCCEDYIGQLKRNGYRSLTQSECSISYSFLLYAILFPILFTRYFPPFLPLSLYYFLSSTPSLCLSLSVYNPKVLVILRRSHLSTWEIALTMLSGHYLRQIGSSVLFLTSFFISAKYYFIILLFPVTFCLPCYLTILSELTSLFYCQSILKLFLSS